MTKIQEKCSYTFHVSEDDPDEFTYAQPECTPIEMEPFSVDDEPYCRFCGLAILIDIPEEDEDCNGDDE